MEIKTSISQVEKVFSFFYFIFYFSFFFLFTSWQETSPNKACGVKFIASELEIVGKDGDCGGLWFKSRTFSSSPSQFTDLERNFHLLLSTTVCEQWSRW